MIPTAHSKVQINLSHEDPEILQMILSDPYLAKFFNFGSNLDAKIQLKVGKNSYSVTSSDKECDDVSEPHDSVTVHPLLSGLVENPSKKFFN